MQNVDIRDAIRKTGFRHFEVADFMKIPETSFSRLLRHELDDKKKTEIKKALSQMQEARRCGRLD